MLKGWKTIIFNLLMLIVTVTGAQVAPEMVKEFAEELIGLLIAGNGILRAITKGPIFNKTE